MSKTRLTNRLSKTTIYGWGQTLGLPLLKGSMGRVLTQPQQLNQLDDYALPKEESVTHLATGWGHSLLATCSNTVYSFGLNKSGQLGKGQVSNRDHAKIWNGDEQVKSLACGREHSHIVTTKENGKTRLYSFGNNMYGQLGTGKNKNTRPGQLVAETGLALVDFKENIEHVVCGLDNTILTTKNGIYGMGWGADGQLGQGFADKDIPSPLKLKCTTKKISSSTDYTLLLTDDQKVWTWGNSEYGQGAQGKKIDRILEPLEIKLNGVRDVAAGGPFSLFLTSDGFVYTCGYGALGLGFETIETLELKKVEGLDNIVKVFATTDYAAALSADGELFTWGLNGPSSRLGLGHTDHAFTPKRVSINKKVANVSLGVNHALVLCED